MRAEDVVGENRFDVDAVIVRINRPYSLGARFEVGGELGVHIEGGFRGADPFDGEI